MFRQTLIILVIVVASCWSQGIDISLGLDILNSLSKPPPPGRFNTLGDVFLRFYSNTNPKSPTSVQLNDAASLISAPGFDPEKLTLVYAHGFTELVTNPSVQTIIQAYTSLGDHNVIMVDWSNLAFGFYTSAGSNVSPVGTAVGAAIAKLVAAGVPGSNLRFVGHSLGAHVAAYSCRTLSQQGITVPNLVGLDPAFPGWYPPFLGAPISVNDASFVVVVHTDGGVLGSPVVVLGDAHVHFLPNGGIPIQPGCDITLEPNKSDDVCSHQRAWQLWAEAVQKGSRGIPARLCTSYLVLLSGLCDRQPSVNMGLTIPTSSRGNYYFRTASSPPFSLGARGAKSLSSSIFSP